MEEGSCEGAYYYPLYMANQKGDAQPVGYGDLCYKFLPNFLQIRCIGRSRKKKKNNRKYDIITFELLMADL